MFHYYLAKNGGTVVTPAPTVSLRPEWAVRKQKFLEI